MSENNNIKKVDNFIKCNGEAKYVDDYIMDDMLFAVTVRSSINRGKILSLSLPDLPEGYYFISAKDVVKENVVKIIFLDWPVFANGYTNYKGEPIGLLIGKDKKVLYSLKEKIKITYQEDEPLFDYTDSYIHKSYDKGDINIAINDSVEVIEETFSTPYQEQVYLEPQGMICYLDGDVITLLGSMQCPFYVKKAVVHTLGCLEDKVRVIQPFVGGAFGGKEHYPSIIGCQLATAVNKIKKPIKMIFDREEDIAFTSKRHPSSTTLTSYIDKNKRIIGLKANIKLNGGAYKGCSGVVLSRALIACCNVYVIPHLKVVGDVYYTNSIPCAAFRGFGSPQTIFAMEMFIDHIAKKLHIDNVSYRGLYLAKKGDLTANSGLFHDNIILTTLIDRAMKMSSYSQKRAIYGKGEYRYKGIGMSYFLHGCGFTGSGEKDIINAKVKLVKDENDHVYIYASSVDIGQGSKSTLSAIVARSLGIRYEDVTFKNVDTKYCLDSGPTAASRTIIIVGGILERASLALKSKWVSGQKIEHIESYIGPSYISWNEDTMQGDAYPAYAWGVNVVEVDIDPVSYEVSVVGCWSTYDCGKTIDERIALGQADGGLVQALGYGYLENINMENGRFKQINLSNYIIPTAKDIPTLKTEFIDNEFKYGPSGAKGLGELTFVGGAPAISLAIENALGVNINKIPVTPEYIMELLKNG